MPKLQLKLVDRKLIGDCVYLVTFHSAENFEYKPGQFLSFKVEEKVFRSYSIVEASQTSSYSNSSEEKVGRFISFIVNTKSGGYGSKLMQDAKIDTLVEAVGPAGRFQLQNTDFPKVFVCTGTGLAPFVPMIKQLLYSGDQSNPITPDLETADGNTENKAKPRIDIYFGAKTSQDKFIDKLFTKEELDQLNTFVSLSNEEPKNGEYKGFVNEALLKNITDYKAAEFYLCGNPVMVESVKAMLEEHQADKVYLEKYTL